MMIVIIKNFGLEHCVDFDEMSDVSFKTPFYFIRILVIKRHSY
jgi:hypothetical protein